MRKTIIAVVVVVVVIDVGAVVVDVVVVVVGDVVVIDVVFIVHTSTIVAFAVASGVAAFIRLQTFRQSSNLVFLFTIPIRITFLELIQ